MSLNGWHPGERAIRQRLEISSETHFAWKWIAAELPDQHRIFYTHNIHFLPLVTLDQLGRPWGSIVAGEDGLPGFIHSTGRSTLVVRAKLWEGDPLLQNLNHRTSEKILAAGIGVEWSTRRRNKLAGYISEIKSVTHPDNIIDFSIVVNEAIGNCPKYITVRSLEPCTPHPKIESSFPTLASHESLSEEAIDIITHADTVFFGTTYHANSEDESRFPSHLGMNQRGGRPGFIRVSPTDRKTVYLPDFSGNRIMTSLGNVEHTPLASLTFVSWQTGDVLYITGSARNLIGAAARAVMPFQNCFTEVTVTGYTYVRDALPTRQKENSTAEASPYSPPIRFLASERPPPTSLGEDGTKLKAKLTQMKIHSPSLITFTWTIPRSIQVKAGQSAILDFTTLLGAQEYQHMNNAKPTAVNDDRIRTWTVSSFSDARIATNTFALTMREKEGGVVTGALFNVARRIQQMGKNELLEDSTPIGLEAEFVGIDGSFFLPEGGEENTLKLLWIAGGIGVTPFLAMLKQLSTEKRAADVQLILTTREPEVLLHLIQDAYVEREDLELHVSVFSRSQVPSKEWGFEVTVHNGRMEAAKVLEAFDVTDWEAFVCGPSEMEKDVLQALTERGAEKEKIHREGFAY
ncbi:hypothetical protein DL96DRAFT_1464965 [Flagelloscypha sp. PMI_526]|nr:hypothetical protein DL96DRAFT_1464965 [Flagelloscypha sp. PMI_526]